MGFWRQRLRRHPNRVLVGGFASAILLGTLLLTPLAAVGARIGLLDALFTATSAVCMTGLTVRDTGKGFSTFGHVVILALIQLGGLGITTLSTAGGIKAPTLAVLFATARARVRGRRWAHLFGRGVSEMAVDKAIGVVALVAVLVVGGTLLLSAVELRHAAHVQTPGRSEGPLFEVVSALSTVGLTTGITPILAPGGKLIVIVLMFVVRLGPLTVAMAIASKKHQWQLPRILVKVANAEQAEIVQLVGATEVIHPEQGSARKTALLIHHPRAVDYLELGGEYLNVAAQPPASAVGKTVGAMALQERHGVALLGLWHAGQQGPPSPPAPDRTIAETDVLILAGHIDRLRELRRLQ